jgi:hypothetical protein
MVERQKCGKIRTLIHYWWECKSAQQLWKRVWRVLKKIELELPYHPVIEFVDMYPKECKTRHSRDTCIMMFITALFTIAKLWKQPTCPTSDERTMKSWYIDNRYYSATRKYDVKFDGKWVQLEDIMLSEVIQDQNHKRCIFFSCVKNRCKDKHIHKNKHDHIQTQLENMVVTVLLLYGTQRRRQMKIEK